MDTGTIEQPLARQALYQSTQVLHAEVETALDLLHDPPSLGHYKHSLVTLARVILPVEQWLHVHRDSVKVDLTARNHSAALLRDLEYLGVRVPSGRVRVPSGPLHPEDIPASTWTAEHAWGLLYVLEGSTLGGQVIAAHLGNPLSLTSGAGMAFFTGYGSRTGSMWKEFLRALQQHVRDAAQIGAAVMAARWFFARVAAYAAEDAAMSLARLEDGWESEC